MRGFLVLLERYLSSIWTSLALIGIQFACMGVALTSDGILFWGWIPMGALVAFDLYRFTVRFLR